MKGSLAHDAAAVAAIRGRIKICASIDFDVQSSYLTQIHRWKANPRPSSHVTERLTLHVGARSLYAEYPNHKAWSDVLTSDCVHMLTNSSQKLSQPIPRYIGKAFSSVYQLALNVNLDSSQAAGTFLSQQPRSKGIIFEA